MNKRLPKMKTDDEAIEFLEKDIGDYLSKDNFSHVSFEFAPKDKNITLRISAPLIQAIQKIAQKKHIPYQKVIRQAIEKLVREEAIV